MPTKIYEIVYLEILKNQTKRKWKFEIRVLRFEFWDSRLETQDSSFSFECLPIGEVQVHGQPMLGAITENEKSFEKFFHQKRTTD